MPIINGRMIPHKVGVQRLRTLYEPNPGLAGVWEEYLFQDNGGDSSGTYYPDTSYTTTDVGSSSAGSGGGWWDSITGMIGNLGSSWISGEVQKDLGTAAINATPHPGTVYTAAGGQVVQQTAAPVSTTISNLLKNPLVLAGLGLGAYLLLRKRH